MRLRSRRSRLLPLGLALALGACGSPATGRQVWFGPNMGSPDMIELFTQPPRWAVAPDGRPTVPANLPETGAAAYTHTRLLEEGLAALRGGTRR